jgi:hypothetical protein
MASRDVVIPIGGGGRRSDDVDRAAWTRRQGKTRVNDYLLVHDRTRSTGRLQRHHTRARLGGRDVRNGPAANAAEFRRAIDQDGFTSQQVLRELHWKLSPIELDK